MRNKINKYWRWFAGLMILFIIILIGLYLRMITVRSSALQSELQKKPVAVEVIEPRATSVWKNIKLLARIEGGQTISLRSDVSGWVKERKVEIGSHVSRGDTLLILSDERKDLALQEAHSRLMAAKANLRELNRLYDRNMNLYKKGIIAKDTQESLKNQIAAQRAEADALEAQYKRAKWDYDHLQVTAPIEGKIIEVIPDVGQEIKVDEPIVRMVNGSSKKVVAGVDSKLARSLAGVKEIKLENNIGDTTETTTARIIGISPNIDMESGTYTLEAEITDPENDWLPGEIVNLEAPVRRLENVKVIPRSAILSDNEKIFLFIYEDGISVKREVEVTWLNDKSGAVDAGLIPSNAKIIVNGNAGLADGQAIRILNN